MPQRRRIESARNRTIKEVALLKGRRARERSGLALVEGVREVGRALEAGLPVHRLLLCPSLWPSGAAAPEEAARAAEAAGAEVLLLSADAFERISLREHPDGMAAVTASPALPLARLALPPSPLVLVLDGLEKPGNVGALLRTADAAGVDGVVVTGSGTDLGNPNVIRASMGSVFAVPAASAPAEEARAWLRAAGIRIVATSPHAERAHWEASYLGPTAVAVGTEHAGLDDAWLSAADDLVRVPMRARLADSLNAAVAGAVVLFEALRQRSA